jgi:hypothetical protein
MKDKANLYTMAHMVSKLNMDENKIQHTFTKAVVDNDEKWGEFVLYSKRTKDTVIANFHADITSIIIHGRNKIKTILLKYHTL